MSLDLNCEVECCGKSNELEVRRVEVPVVGLWSLKFLEPWFPDSFARYEGEGLLRFCEL